MSSYKEVVIQRNLQRFEYDQLVSKGYCKLKVDLTLEHLREFQSKYKVGDPFVFHTPTNADLRTTLTSIDTGEPHGDQYRVFIGFTLM